MLNIILTFLVGQLWIKEDKQQESFSQKIQLTNSSLRVEHSLKLKLKNDLLRNILQLSHHFPQILDEESTLITSPYEYFYQTSILTTTESNEEELFVESSTIKFNEKTSRKRSLLFVNQTNIGWILSLIILSSFIYGLWTIQGHYRFIWYIQFDSPIQFLVRRLIRSSTRSPNKIATLVAAFQPIIERKSNSM